MAGRVKIKVEGLERTRREIDRLRKRLGLSAAEFSDTAAGVVRDTVVRNAQPFGTGKKAMEAGKRAVRGDLMRCMRPVPEGYRGRGQVISSMSEAKSWHRSRRGRSGRVTRGERRPVLQSIFRGYVEQVQARVGMAKGSVAGGADRRLGGRLASWVKRWKAVGDASRRRRIGGAQWTFRADAEHAASPRVLGARGVARVLRNVERNLARVLGRKLKRELSRGGRRINRRR